MLARERQSQFPQSVCLLACRLVCFLAPQVWRSLADERIITSYADPRSHKFAVCIGIMVACSKSADNHRRNNRSEGKLVVESEIDLSTESNCTELSQKMHVCSMKIHVFTTTTTGDGSMNVGRCLDRVGKIPLCGFCFVHDQPYSREANASGQLTCYMSGRLTNRLPLEESWPVSIQSVSLLTRGGGERKART